MESPFLHTHGVLRCIGLFLSGVCHQLPEHSLFISGVQIPLCARCTGTYLGALLGLCNVWLRGRSRASRMPQGKVLAVMGVFFAAWAIDGLNSYLYYLTGSRALYTPSNWLRLASGLASGLSLSLLILPMFNMTFWREPDSRRILDGPAQLLGPLVQVAGLVMLFQANLDALLYLTVLVELLSVVLLLSIVNSMIVIILLHRENRAEHWSQALPPFVLGLLLTWLEVGGMALLRHYLVTLLPAPLS